VISRKDHDDDQLVAYVTLDEKPLENLYGDIVEKLRDQLRECLPGHMIPSALVILDKLPLTSNGKLDRKALPVPDRESYKVLTYEAPLGEAENLLAGIWEDLLNVTQVSRHDNFFALGGHSLKILQMSTKLNQYNQSISMQLALKAESLSDMAQMITPIESVQFSAPINRVPNDCEKITPEMLPLVDITESVIDKIAQSLPGGMKNIQDIYPLSSLQMGILLHHQMKPVGDTYVMNSLLEIGSDDDLDNLCRALNNIISRHDVFRTAIVWKLMKQPLQVVLKEAALPVAEVSLQDGQSAREYFEEKLEPQNLTMDIDLAPKLRLEISRDPKTNEWLGLIQTHHIVVDHVSLDVIQAEVEAFLNGKEDDLPKAYQYRDFIAYCQSYNDKQDGKDFFMNHLNAICEPTYPFGLSRVSGFGENISEYSEKLNADITQKITLLSKTNKISPAVIFHAGWANYIAKNSGEHNGNVVFGTVLSGRTPPINGIEGMLGLFINTLPMSVHIEEDSQTLLHACDQTLQQLIAFEQMPLSVAQSCANVKRGTPLFSSLLNYRHGKEIKSGGVYKKPNEWSGYPVTISIDYTGSEFKITSQTDMPIDPKSVLEGFNFEILKIIKSL